ncbi:MAG: exosome complex protein Rrp42 [Candidatus Diapherotrites archaeon]|nr:exosome complex protein Rrp42 [Candidatus Diapherotrites archaeon]
MSTKEDIIWELRSEEVLKSIKQGKRMDGRDLLDYRTLKIETNVSENADGSARAFLGESQSITGVKMIVDKPYPDNPDEGTISVGVELLPLASPTFESGPPKTEAIELSRVVDRGIREAKTLDFKKLSLVAGEKCWVVFIDSYVINHAGNLFDTCSLSSMAALMNCRVPKLEENKIVRGEFEGKLELTNLPILTTFAKIGNQIVVDTSYAEEKAMSARFSIATFEGKKFSALQKGGHGSFTQSEVDHCIDIAFEKGDELRSQLKKFAGGKR